MENSYAYSQAARLYRVVQGMSMGKENRKMDYFYEIYQTGSNRIFITVETTILSVSIANPRV
jgi:acyl-CoA thioesterase FadM